MNPASSTNAFPLLKRQFVACAMFGALLAAIIGALYFQHRQREWALRTEQAQHRLNIAFELVSLEVNRVRSDATYLANRSAVRQFVSGDESTREKLEADFSLFVEKKGLYDQLRVLDLDGHETIRINLNRGKASAVASNELQDKADRYYFQASRALQPGEIFVSDFDLNVEHGSIERPFKPVIRFVTPVINDSNHVRAFLVLNYLGADLLSELGSSPVPGQLLLLRQDGHYVRGTHDRDAWGWLLNHDRSFANDFPDEWADVDARTLCRLTESGAFAFKKLPLGRVGNENHVDPPGRGADNGNEAPGDEAENSLWAVSYLPNKSVFAASNELLQRLVIFSAGVFAIAIVFTRAWARATWSRQQQALRITESEERLRELSSRLLRIQESERRAISREIHDELGQQATAINLDLKLALRNIGTGKAGAHLQRAIDENETLLRTLHAFAKRVRPAVLDDLGLADAIETHLGDFAERTGVHVDANISLPPDAIPNEIADNTFRLVQESLNNVAKHANAKNVEVDIRLVEQKSPTLSFLISDDGRGYGTEDNGRGLGLVGMRERVDLLGGEIQIESTADCGTSISIQLPLRNTSEPEETCP